MQKKDVKNKVWLEDNKVKIKNGAKVVSLCAASLVVGSFLRGKYDLICMTLGLKGWYVDGMIKFFDPDTGLAVSPEEFCNILKRR